MTDLLELAERCEASTGPDQALDRDIQRAVAPDDLMQHYTASLDAAMSLVDDELVTVVMSGALDRLDACFNPLENYLTNLRLFVCAAALRARATLSEDAK